MLKNLANTIHSAFHIAINGRPGPVLVDIPKDIQTHKTIYKGKKFTNFITIINQNLDQMTIN